MDTKFDEFSKLLDQFADFREKWRIAEKNTSEDEHKIWLQMDAVRMKIWRLINGENKY